jgi:hypothetical protein
MLTGRTPCLENGLRVAVAVRPGAEIKVRDEQSPENTCQLRNLLHRTLSTRSVEHKAETAAMFTSCGALQVGQTLRQLDNALRAGLNHKLSAFNASLRAVDSSLSKFYSSVGALDFRLGLGSLELSVGLVERGVRVLERRIGLVDRSLCFLELRFGLFELLLNVSFSTRRLGLGFDAGVCQNRLAACKQNQPHQQPSDRTF